jgi:ribose transport system ATP-binding protein
VAVVYISHRFGEVERLCDEVTVLRDGRTVDRLTGERRNQHELVAAIVAEAEMGAPAQRRRKARDASPLLLKARGITGARLRGFNLDLARGEILGLCGLPGSGVNELMEILGGAQRPVSGTITVEDSEVDFVDPADALACGVSYLPVERARAGMLDLTIRANLMASSLARVARMGVTTASIEKRFVDGVVSELGLQRRIEEPLRALSGGNRQKILLSRCLLANARVLVLDDPTVGVDVKARQDIHDLLARIVEEGRAVVVAVSEPEELVGIADRVLVLSRGQVAAELEGDHVTSEALVRAVTTAGAVQHA